LVNFGVTDALSALTPQLRNAGGQSVDDRSVDVLPPESAEPVSEAALRVGAFAQTTGDRATLLRLRPSPFSWLTFPAEGATGLALAEIYDADRAPGASTLSNLSTRATLTPVHSTLTIGFVIAGAQARTLMLRAVGPTLRNFGVARPAADPVLTLFRENGTVIAQNDDWGKAVEARQLRQFAPQRGAFPLDEDGKDAALAITLPPGSYTFQIRDRSGGGGDILGEIYDVP
jgi:hypothetical protein